MEKFLTLFSALYICVYLLMVAYMVYAFTQLSTWQQESARITLHNVPFTIFLGSIAWLISRAF